MMRLAQSGDRQSYSVLLAECAKWLERYFRHRIPPHQLDDLVQETLMSLHRKLATYDPARPFLPWLAAIARYRWVDQLRRVYRSQEVELADDIAVGSQEDEIMARVSLDRLLSFLTPAQVSAITLVKIEGRSIAEAAVSSGQSEPLVKVNIHRGLKKLAAVIEKAQ